MILCPDSKRASIELSRKLSIKGYLCTIFKSVVSSIKYKQRRKKKKEVRICRKFLCLLWNLQYWSIEHEVSRSKIKRLWNFFDSFLMSLQFCSVFFWFMLPKVWKYDRDFYSIVLKESLIFYSSGQRVQFLNAWEHFWYFFAI